MVKVNNKVKRTKENISENVVEKINTVKKAVPIKSPKLKKKKSNLKKEKQAVKVVEKEVFKEKINEIITNNANEDVDCIKNSIPEELVSNDTVKKSLNVIKDFMKNHKKEKNIFDDDYKYMLVVNSIKIPRCPHRITRMQIPNGLNDKSSDICLFVCDLKRGRKVDFEPTIAHYKDILQQNNVDFVNTVMPMTQVSTEYLTFEMKRKLAASHDLFLADSRITKHLFGFLGKTFIKHKKVPTAVDMSKKDLKAEIEKKLNTIMYKQNPNGAVTSINIGKPSLSDDQVTENVEFVLNSLKNTYPGGWGNIRSVYLTASVYNSITCPLYMTTVSANDVKVPVVEGPVKTAILKGKNQLNMVLKDFHIKNNGQLVKNDFKAYNIEDPIPVITADIADEVIEPTAEPIDDTELDVDEESDVDDEEDSDEEEFEEPKKVVLPVKNAKKKAITSKVVKPAPKTKAAKKVNSTKGPVKPAEKTNTKTTPPPPKVNAKTTPPPKANKKSNKKEILQAKKAKIAKNRVAMPVC